MRIETGRVGFNLPRATVRCIAKVCPESQERKAAHNLHRVEGCYAIWEALVNECKIELQGNSFSYSFDSSEYEWCLRVVHQLFKGVHQHP